jgi:hypothetical protein
MLRVLYKSNKILLELEGVRSDGNTKRVIINLFHFEYQKDKRKERDKEIRREENANRFNVFSIYVTFSL